MEELLEYRQRLISRFRSIADELISLVEKASPNSWHTLPNSSGWSTHKTAAHLRDIEAQLFWPRFMRILQEEVPTLEHFDEFNWVETVYRPEEPLEEILSDYQDLRSREVAWFETLLPEAWSRVARHPQWGARTLQWWVERDLAHAQDHLRQLAEA